MTCIYFELMMRYLHMTKWESFEIKHKNPRFEKIGKTKWMVDELRGKFKAYYNLRQVLTMDEMILCYK